MLDYRFEHRPDFGSVVLSLQAGQRVFAEPGAMATMAPGLAMKAGLKGGLLRSVGRMFAGENLVVNTFTAEKEAELMLVPGPPGDVEQYVVSPDAPLMLQRGAFLACSDGVNINTSFQGARGFFSGEGLFLLRAEGQGQVFFNTYGALIPIDVSGSYYVDTGYIAAFESTLQYQITTLPGMNTRQKIKSFVFGGESLVCRFSGVGRVWVQTRAVAPFVRWIYPYRSVQQSRE